MARRAMKQRGKMFNSFWHHGKITIKCLSGTAIWAQARAADVNFSTTERRLTEAMGWMSSPGGEEKWAERLDSEELSEPRKRKQSKETGDGQSEEQIHKTTQRVQLRKAKRIKLRVRKEKASSKARMTEYYSSRGWRGYRMRKGPWMQQGGNL